MMVPSEINLEKTCLLFCLVVAIGLTGGVKEEVAGGAPPQDADQMTTEVKKQKLFDVAGPEEKSGGCNLEEDEPYPKHPVKCQVGIPHEIPLEWACAVVGTIPNQTCHWMHEDKFGCDNGGSGKMCDTVGITGGTQCKCRNIP